MNTTTQIIKTFDEINEKISELTKGDSQLCDYDTFQQMMEMWIIPDHIDASESEQFMSDFQAYLQYNFEDELGDILDNLKDVSEYVFRKVSDCQVISDIKILSDLSEIRTLFQDYCENKLYNIRLKLNESQLNDSAKDVSHPVNYFEIRNVISSNPFDEEEPIKYLNRTTECEYHFDKSKFLKLSETACQILIEGCNYGRKWINSDFLAELAMIEPDLGMSYEYFELYERAVCYNWNDVITEFRDKNQSLAQFCDFFERGIRKYYEINPETDQVTSS